MAFDIDNTLKDMLAAIEGVVAASWPKIKSCVEKALQDEKAAMEDIAKARLDGAIDDEEMKSEIEDEEKVLEAALLVCQIKGKRMAQESANAAIKVLGDAIKAALELV